MKIPSKLQHYGLEFLTVFLGVSLSLVAENWRQRQADTSAEHNSLVRLYNDLRNEGSDVRVNAGRAETGLAGARWLLVNRARGHSPDSVSAAMTAVGTCSFFIPYTSEYTALKSSGRLSIIEDVAIRENLVRFYEGDAFVQWLQERDCLQTSDLMDSLLGRVDLAEPDTSAPPAPVAPGAQPAGAGRDTTRGRGRAGGGGGGGPRGPDRRFPVVTLHAGNESLLDDAVLRGRFVRVATQRRYLVQYLQGRGTEINNIRAQLKTRLGADTLAISEGRNRGGGFRRP